MADMWKLLARQDVCRNCRSAFSCDSLGRLCVDQAARDFSRLAGNARAVTVLHLGCFFFRTDPSVAALTTLALMLMQGIALTLLIVTVALFRRTKPAFG